MVAHFQISIVVLDQWYLVVAAHQVLVRLVQVLQEAVIKLLSVALLPSFALRVLNEVLYICDFGSVISSNIEGLFWFEAPAGRSVLMTRHHGPLLLKILRDGISLLACLVQVDVSRLNPIAIQMLADLDNGVRRHLLLLIELRRQFRRLRQ